MRRQVSSKRKQEYKADGMTCGASRLPLQLDVSVVFINASSSVFHRKAENILDLPVYLVITSINFSFTVQEL